MVVQQDRDSGLTFRNPDHGAATCLAEIVFTSHGARHVPGVLAAWQDVKPFMRGQAGAVSVWGVH